MQLSQFLPFYLMFVVAGALAVTGWFFITRGEKVLLPDGTYQAKGKIFKGWYFFWTQTVGKKKIYYSGNPLMALWQDYQNDFEYKNPFGFIVGQSSWVAPTNKMDELLNNIKLLETRLQVKIELKSNIVFFYKEFDKYRFPSWLRDPLAVCSTCFASVYGSIFYWGVLALANHVVAEHYNEVGDTVYSYTNVLFAWAEHVLLAKIFFWISFCMSLAVINTALAKKFN